MFVDRKHGSRIIRDPCPLSTPHFHWRHTTKTPGTIRLKFLCALSFAFYVCIAMISNPCLRRFQGSWYVSRPGGEIVRMRALRISIRSCLKELQPSKAPEHRVAHVSLAIRWNYMRTPSTRRRHRTKNMSIPGLVPALLHVQNGPPSRRPIRRISTSPYVLRKKYAC